MPKVTRVDSDQPSAKKRVNTEITERGFKRMKLAAELLTKTKPGRSTHGTVIDSLIMKHLPPHPDELIGLTAESESAPPQPGRKRVKSAKRNTEAKAQTA